MEAAIPKQEVGDPDGAMRSILRIAGRLLAREVDQRLRRERIGPQLVSESVRGTGCDGRFRGEAPPSVH